MMIHRIFLILLLLGPIACTAEPVASESGQETGNSVQTTNLQETMVKIPAGAFLYGATENQFRLYLSGYRVNFPGMVEHLRSWFVIPPEMVELPTFYIDEFEVTNAEFHDFVSSAGYGPERDTFLKHWEGKGRPPEWAGSFPVVWVSQNDARAYCEWLGARLPTEEEWEKAARGASGRIFPWGNEPPTEETANFNSTALEPAGNRPGDVSPYGVYDLGGNASEWTDTRVTVDGTEIAVIRGGSYEENLQEMLTFKRFLQMASSQSSQVLGFRCATD